MLPITFVTSNPNKAREAASILGNADIISQALDIPEIQSFSLEEIVQAKAEYAQQHLRTPVLVEDVAFDVAVLKGFPGPFIKFWEKVGGHDVAAEIGEKMGNTHATARCGIGYADGKQFVYVEGKIDGTIIPRRGNEGWGFDFYFVPHGYTQTFSEMGPDAKNLISHRRKAWELMQKELQRLRILAS